MLGLVTPTTGQEQVELSRATGRIAAESLCAPVNLPPFRSSAMDGYALAGEAGAGTTLSIVGESLAGHPFQGSVGTGQCVRITTGAVVPDSADRVIIQENTERQGERLTVTKAAEPGANIREPGHDVLAGTEVVPPGRRLNPFDIGWLAACGITHLQVSARPRVAVFSTGDELAPPGSPLGPGQIFDSNRFALASLLERSPVQVTDLGVLPDDRSLIREALDAAAAEHDLLLTSGGVSVGDADYVKDVVEDLGRIDFWRLNLKPGKPLAFGWIDATPFLGLPGNPVSTIVTYLLIARPLIDRLAGGTPTTPPLLRATLGAALSHSPGREEYQRGQLERKEAEILVRPCGDQSSNRLATFAAADCLIRVAADAGNLAPGTEVDVLPFNGLLS